MIRIEVNDAAAVEKQVPYKGKVLVLHEQEAWAYLLSRQGKLNPHPTKIIITHDKPENVYPKGVYMLAPESVYADGYGKLTLGRVRLNPTKG